MPSAAAHTSISPSRVVTGADVGDRVRAGVAAGLFGGFAFLLANMWFAGSQDKPSVAPLLSISTIFHAQDMPVMTPQNVVVGLVLHIALSMLFGVVFALVVVPLLHTLQHRRAVPGTQAIALLVFAALIYGLGLFVVNFEIFGRTTFPWFTNPMGPNNVFELVIHPIAYGLFLVPFFLTTRSAARPATDGGS